MPLHRREDLLVGVTAAGSSTWLDFERVWIRSVQVEFAGVPGGDSVEIHGRNGETQPAPTDDGEVLATVNTQFKLTDLTTPGKPYCRWLKAKKAGTAQAVSVRIDGVYINT